LVAVDDEPGVLRAVERDLRRHFGGQYRIVRASSGAEALAALNQLRQRDDAVALLLVDQRMPTMSGVQLLEQAMPLYPSAKRVLLTAYADTDAAIRAINNARIDYYLLKPWDPPEERLYPVLDDLLDDWQAGYRPRFQGVRLIGSRWSAACFETREFMARNHVPYRWLEVETDPEATDLLNSAGLDAKELPVLLFPEGTHLVAPAHREIAERVGLRTRADQPFYDLIIVGGGPAGLAAGVYGGSEGLRTVLIEGVAPGGQAGTSSRIENYLGFPTGVSGGDLARRAVTQARRFGIEILTPQEVTSARADGQARIVTLADGTELGCYALLIASGVTYRRLDVPGLEPLVGAGVYYGASVTDAAAYRDQDVYIVGGANSAGQAAAFAARFARQVTLVVRGDSLAASMSHYLIRQLEETANVRVWLQSNVTAVGGQDHLESVDVCDASGTARRVPAAALFIFIGATPRTEWLGDFIARDEYGFVLTGVDVTASAEGAARWSLEREPFYLETSTPGIFAAGDVRHGATRRVASGVGEGSIAVQLIHRYLRTV
jgi:thioredoxin reductase (NADPH)